MEGGSNVMSCAAGGRGGRSTVHVSLYVNRTREENGSQHALQALLENSALSFARVEWDTTRQRGCMDSVGRNQPMTL